MRLYQGAEIPPVAGWRTKRAGPVPRQSANPAERYQLVAECKNNPGKFKDDPDCINANDSMIQEWGKTKLPPLNFSQKPGVAATK